MERIPAVPLCDHLASLTDPRCTNARHRLLDILAIAICAVLCGAEGWEDMEAYGQAQAEWCKQVLDVPRGIPSHDTFRRVLARLDPDKFMHCFLTWTQALSERSAGEIVAVDGKTLRRSFDRAASKAAIPMVRAWANTNRLVLGQLKVEDKSNEITAIPQLLALLDLQGCLVTIDAMGCQKDIAQTITQQGADDVLALKENHPTLYEDVTLFLQDAKVHNVGQIAYPCEETVDADHGRLEIRTYWITSDIEWLGAKASWANLQSVGMVESRREVGDQGAVATHY
jgi:predicted transposase YbfD/YdcC